MSRSTTMEMLSDDGDLFSDDDEPSASYIQSGVGSGTGHDSNRHDRNIPSAADRRAHHNALERKRRDHIKDSFSSLRDSVPSLHGEKASRAQILKKAAEYIQMMKKKNTNVQNDIEDIKKQNKLLEEQIRSMENKRPSSASSTPTMSQMSASQYSNVQSSLSLLSSGESTNGVSPSYGDISENSNESNDLNVLMNGRNTIENISGNGHHHSNGRLIESPISITSNGSNVIVTNHTNNNNNNNNNTTNNNNNVKNTITAFSTIRRRQQSPAPLTTQQAQLLINRTSTTGTTVRSVVKNGTSTIIVQNPQIKHTPAIGQPHVIHVASATNNNTNSNNTSNITATPIIISTTNGNVAGGGGIIMPSNAVSTNSYTVLSKTGSGALTLSGAASGGNSVTHNGACRTVLVSQNQAASANQSGTTTPNIHILSNISSYVARASINAANTGTTKRFKISTDNNNGSSIETVVVNANNINTSASLSSSSSGTTLPNSTATTQPPSFNNVTSVSS